MSNPAITHRLGVGENAICKLVGPSGPASNAPLTFAAIPAAADGLLAASDAPAATPADAKNANASAEEGAVDRDPITAPEVANDDKPVPMNHDCDAEDRTFDRQLAYLGLLDDAAPLFREGSSVPGAGVLLALSCLVESGLFRISRKLYGEVGPASYEIARRYSPICSWRYYASSGANISRRKIQPRSAGFSGSIVLRRRLTRLAAHHCAEQLGAELARVRVDQRGHLMGFLCIDGHVRAYHGERPKSERRRTS
jgi:hypothetical protein